MSRGSLTDQRFRFDEAALHVRIKGDPAGNERHTAKPRVLGVVRRGRQYGARGGGEAEWKPKGLKQARVGVLHEQGQPGNRVMLKR